MKRVKVLVFACVLFPFSALADNVGNCGWGSKLFHGQRGIAPQVLAVTTNGTSGNQTFAISSGTSGCSQDGVVTSSWQTAAYVDSNMNKLARDMSRGNGEGLDSLAALLQVPAEHKPVLARTLQDNFAVIYPAEGVSSEEVVLALRQVLSSHAVLSQYAVNV